MLIDSKELDNGSLIESEVIIIGGGIAGITLAKQLSRSGHDVAILESGSEEPDYQTQMLYSGSATMGTPGIETRNIDSYLLSSRLRYYGGSGNHWDGLCAPLDPVDFMQRDWIPYSGWPFTLEQLQPFYDRACDFLEIPKLDDDLRLPHSVGDPTINLGNSQGLISRPHYFTQYTGLKASGPYKTLKQQIANHNCVIVYLNANVTNIALADDGKQVKSLQISCLNGRKHKAQGRAYLLATGGIENVRLLLNSNNICKTGIGNYTNWLGRCFQGHAIISEPNNSSIFLAGPEKSKLYSYIQRKLYKKHRTSYVLGTTMKAQFEAHTSNFSVYANNKFERKSINDAIEGLAFNLVQSKSETIIGNHSQAYFPIEHTPNRKSRIKLIPDILDDLGMPRVNLEWRNSKLDFVCFERSMSLLVKELGVNNLGRVQWSKKPYDTLKYEFKNSELNINGFKESSIQAGKQQGIHYAGEIPWSYKNLKSPDYLQHDRSHHMGSTRMSVNPNDGVVNEHCQIHGVHNLFVAGSSVFPTSGIANPTLTIIALAFRMGDYLDNKLRK